MRAELTALGPVLGDACVHHLPMHHLAMLVLDLNAVALSDFRGLFLEALDFQARKRTSTVGVTLRVVQSAEQSAMSFPQSIRKCTTHLIDYYLRMMISKSILDQFHERLTFDVLCERQFFGMNVPVTL